MSDLTAIENVIAQLTPRQHARLSEIHSRVRLELAKEYGDMLAPVIVESLVRASTISPDILAALEGVTEQHTSTDRYWRSFAKGLVKQDELAQRNLAFRAEARNAEIRGEELSKITPSRRMHLARSGELEGMLDTLVSARQEFDR